MKADINKVNKSKSLAFHYLVRLSPSSKSQRLLLLKVKNGNISFNSFKKLKKKKIIKKMLEINPKLINIQNGSGDTSLHGVHFLFLFLYFFPIYFQFRLLKEDYWRLSNFY